MKIADTINAVTPCFKIKLKTITESKLNKNIDLTNIFLLSIYNHLNSACG